MSVHKKALSLHPLDPFRWIKKYTHEIYVLSDDRMNILLKRMKKKIDIFGELAVIQWCFFVRDANETDREIRKRVLGAQRPGSSFPTGRKDPTKKNKK